VQAFTDLATAAYCPRKLYYRRTRDDRDSPDSVAPIRNLAFRYGDLLDPETDLADEPIAVTPTAYRSALGCSKARLDRWENWSIRPKRGLSCAARTPTGSHTSCSRNRPSR